MKATPTLPQPRPAAIFLVRGYLAPMTRIGAAGDRWLLGASARFVFAAVLFVYYWNSALTKISESVFGFLVPSVGAYAQILPGVAERAGYDIGQIALPYKAIVLLGTWSEFVLPLLIVVGLFTRFAALGMIGFIIVQSIVDVTGHGADAATLGMLFDRVPDSAVLDQRLLWLFLLLVLVVKGPGLLSCDALAARCLRA